MKINWAKSFVKISIVAVSIILTSTIAAAGPAGAGSDAWTSYMERDNLFVPHLNYCSSSETFVTITPDSRGFCIDNNRNSTLKTWIEARQTCVSAGKRLPEVAELQYACLHYTSTVTGFAASSWEFGSNFGYSALDTHSGLDGVGVSVFGYTNCYSVVTAAIAVGNTGTTAYFRCVR